jgi:DNA processing protein
MDALDRQLALGRAPGLTAALLRGALRALSASEPSREALEALIGQPRERLAALGLPAAACEALHSPPAEQLAADRAWAQRADITLVHALQDTYPRALVQLPDAPALLYVRGDSSCLASAQLAIVGTRSPTESNRRTARDFSAYLARSGLTITSGLALGIDAAAHEGALSTAGRTLAVLGCGLDRIYPAEHHDLAESIAAQGALVSEWPPGTAPRKHHFPLRNRLISGLALGVLVVEAARQSGSLITARLAGEQGREVFAIPGSIHNPLARGCHALIRAGAKLVESAQDVLEELQIPEPQQVLMSFRDEPERNTAGPSVLDKDYKILLDALGFEPTSVDLLVARSGLSSQSVASMLLILELEGAVALQADGRYMRLPA